MINFESFGSVWLEAPACWMADCIEWNLNLTSHWMAKIIPCSNDRWRPKAKAPLPPIIKDKGGGQSRRKFLENFQKVIPAACLILCFWQVNCAHWLFWAFVTCHGTKIHQCHCQGCQHCDTSCDGFGNLYLLPFFSLKAFMCAQATVSSSIFVDYTTITNIVKTNEKPMTNTSILPAQPKHRHSISPHELCTLSTLLKCFDVIYFQD